MRLKPITHNTLSYEVVEQVMGMIQAGGLKVGDKLPSERLLSEQLKVGRSSVREAMKTMQGLGLINRSTSGTIICEPEITPEKLGISSRHTEISEVIETRSLIEIQAAGLAAERAKPEDIAKLEKALEGFDLIEDLETYSSRDKAFHKAIVDASHNSILTCVYQLISVLLFKTHNYHSLLFQNHIVSEEETMTSRNITMEEHKKILEGIRSHDAQSASEAVKNHLNRVAESLLEKMERT